MIRASLTGLALTLAPAVHAETPADIVAQAPAADWLPIAADSLLVMDVAPAADGKPRRVVVQLVPPPFAPRHVANIRTLARGHWWDGTSINRVQDNYVVQWGDATEQKPLPPELQTVPQSDYVVARDRLPVANAPGKAAQVAATATAQAPAGWYRRDAYADWVGIDRGWPIAGDAALAWPVHCYGMVGVGRGATPDTGTGAELYVVIGQPTRQLDRNIALVGRVIAGIEHLSSLPRGTGPLGFYETAGERVPIRSVRLASDLPLAERPRYEYLSTDSMAFARYVARRANRKDDFYFQPAGGIDVCNILPPVRMVKG